MEQKGKALGGVPNRRGRRSRGERRKNSNSVNRTSSDDPTGSTAAIGSTPSANHQRSRAASDAVAAASSTIPRERRNEARSSPWRNQRRHSSGTVTTNAGRGHSGEATSPSPATTNENNNISLPYPTYVSLEECLERYRARDDAIVRGKMRATSRDGGAFVTCDRGWHTRDIYLPTQLERNRALDGDVVFVELNPEEEGDGHGSYTATFEVTHESDEAEVKARANDAENEDGEGCLESWQDDPIQVKLWNPLVTGIPMRSSSKRSRPASVISHPNTVAGQRKQRTGRVIHVLLPKPIASELKVEGADTPVIPNRRIVGSIQKLSSGTLLFNPQQRSLPQFKCPPSTQRLIAMLLLETERSTEGHPSGHSKEVNNAEDLNPLDQIVFQAEYVPLTWKESHKWPPCCNVERLGDALSLEHEIQALLISFAVDHGDFPPQVLKHVDETVRSGIFYSDSGRELEWRPTPEMLKGRRDYRNERIFTIDPTTAKDLDDALHIKLIEGDSKNRGIVEVGVHIADVSYFVAPGTPVDDEAQRRTTTVYLVDRTVPMLPRPLCEIACSLNENVERLAFSCVWKMYLDGTLVPGADSVWYGRTVIKSCARLDYSTAQNIIDGKVATGEACLDDELWPTHRRPTEPHTIDQVAADVRIMHKVAMARRLIRFENGALELHGTKLAFQLDTDGQTPLLVAPYPIRDSNRLVEEYMLLANYLVAQRLITHARRRAVLRMHPEPLMEGLDSVVNVAAAAGVTIDIETAQTLHKSLVQLGRQGDPLLLQCVTNLLMTPMQAAEYFVTGCRENPEEWRHYALNIPYYTHFTSPIRRYPDVLVHRLLQATIDGPTAVEEFPMDEETLEALCVHSNEKRLASKNAQERCDRVYLSLLVRQHPLESQLGIVLSVGQSSFTVFLPGLGTSAILYLMEHKSMLTYSSDEAHDSKRRILLQRRPGKGKVGWQTLEIEVLVKVSVTVVFKDKPPIDIKARLEGPWKG